MDRQLIQDLKKRLAAGNAREVIDRLQGTEGLDERAEHLLLLTAAALNQQEAEARKGFLTAEMVQAGYNRLTDRLLRILTAIENPEQARWQDLYAEAPLIQTINTGNAQVGQELHLEGSGFGPFAAETSRVLIGPAAAYVSNWSPARISCYVPDRLRPGDYQLSVQTGAALSNPVPVTISLLSPAQRAAIQNGDQSLLLVAQVYGDNQDQLLQADLVEQIQWALEDNELLRDRSIVAAWPEPFFGPNALAAAQQAGGEQGARLLLFGRMGQERSFYPRLAIINTGEAFRRTEERLAVISREMQSLDQPEHLFSEERVNNPIRLLHFIAGWQHHQRGQYAEARRHFLEVLSGKELPSIDRASFHFALGQSSLRLGGDLLEKPRPEERSGGEALITEALEYFRKAADEYRASQQPSSEALAYLNLAMALFSREKTKETLEQVIDFSRRALAGIAREKFPLEYLMVNYNLSSALEWIAWKYEGEDREDRLEQSLAVGREALAAAEAYATPADQVFCRSAGIAVSLGHLHRGDRDENLRRAIALVEQDLPFYRDHPDAMPGRKVLSLNHLGNCYVRLLGGDRRAFLEKARQAFTEGLADVGPDHFPEYFQMLKDNLALTEGLLRRLDSIPGIAPLLTLPDFEAKTRLDLAIHRQRREGKNEEARQTAFQRLHWATGLFHSFHPEVAISYDYLAAAYAALEDPDSARFFAYAALAIMDDAARQQNRGAAGLVEGLRQNLETILKKTGTWPEDERFIRQALGGAVANARQQFQQALQLGDSDLAAALRSYDQALAWCPLYPEALVNRASLYQRTGDLRSALADLNQALALNPRDVIGRYNRASVLLAGGNPAAAESDLNAALAFDPGNSDLVRLRAQLYILQEDRPKAKADLDRLFALEGETPVNLLVRAKAHETFGKKREAIADLGKVLESIEDPQVRAEIEKRIEGLKG